MKILLKVKNALYELLIIDDDFWEYVGRSVVLTHLINYKTMCAEVFSAYVFIIIILLFFLLLLKTFVRAYMYF